MVRVTASAIRLSVGLISGYSPELVLASVLTERDYVSPTDAINIKNAMYKRHSRRRVVIADR